MKAVLKFFHRNSLVSFLTSENTAIKTFQTEKKLLAIFLYTKAKSYRATIWFLNCRMIPFDVYAYLPLSLRETNIRLTVFNSTLSFYSKLITQFSDYSFHFSIVNLFQADMHMTCRQWSLLLVAHGMITFFLSTL